MLQLVNYKSKAIKRALKHRRKNYQMKKLVPQIRATKGDLKHTRKNYQMKKLVPQMRVVQRIASKATIMKLVNLKIRTKNKAYRIQK